MYKDRFKDSFTTKETEEWKEAHSKKKFLTNMKYNYNMKVEETERLEKGLKNNYSDYEEMEDGIKYWRRVIDKTEECIKAGGEQDVSSLISQ